MVQVLVTPHFFPIAAVERDTGLSKDTLRVWERRYGFPQPARDAHGERSYPADQMEKLRVIRRLLDRGHRPGKIVALSLAELKTLSEQTPPGPKAPRSNTRGRPRRLTTNTLTPNVAAVAHTEQAEFLASLMQLIQQHQIDLLRQRLAEATLRMGLVPFIEIVAAPLAHLVGESWALGQLAVFEEHLFSESLNQVLRHAISTIPVPDRGLAPPCPRILLTTFPQESHGLGLLMAEAIFTIEGARCISLGVQTPILEIAQAAHSQACDIVALSFSASQNPNLVISGLHTLRQQLPAHIEIWVGGSCPILHRRPPPGIQVLTGLAAIPASLQAWRHMQTSISPI